MPPRNLLQFFRSKSRAGSIGSVSQGSVTATSTTLVLSESFFVEKIVFNVLISFSLELVNHYCSPQFPCRVAHIKIASWLSLRLLSSVWNTAVDKNKAAMNFFNPTDSQRYRSKHISGKVRQSVLLRWNRVFKTISTEDGDRGVFIAYRFSGQYGCEEPLHVFVKAWLSSTDSECIREARAYSTLQNPKAKGVPSIYPSGFDSNCQVYAIVIEKLGASLEDIRNTLPRGIFPEHMVLTIAIQMLERYEDFHRRGLIHNGAKPGNLCLPGPQSTHQRLLYAIDFGASYMIGSQPEKRRPRGSTPFISVLTQLGLSQTQRDDLESLAYLISYLAQGRLPWYSDKYSPSYEKTWQTKMSTSPRELFFGMHQVYTEFWRDVKCLAHGEYPDYDRLRSGFIMRQAEIETLNSPTFAWP